MDLGLNENKSLNNIKDSKIIITSTLFNNDNNINKEPLKKI